MKPPRLTLFASFAGLLSILYCCNRNATQPAPVELQVTEAGLLTLVHRSGWRTQVHIIGQPESLAMPDCEQGPLVIYRTVNGGLQGNVISSELRQESPTEWSADLALPKVNPRGP